MRFTKIKTKAQDWIHPRFERFREWIWTPRGQKIAIATYYAVTVLVLFIAHIITPKPEPPQQYEMVRVVYPPPTPMVTTPVKIKVVKPIVQEEPTHVFQYLD